jgi:hypothetical protein
MWSWQASQTTRVLRRRFAMMLFHWGWVGPGCGEFGERADMVHMHHVVVLAEFAASLQEPVDQFLSGVGDPFRAAVIEHRRFLPYQWNATEPCDQWPAVAALDDGLETPAWAAWRRDLGLVLGRDLRHG